MTKPVIFLKTVNKELEVEISALSSWKGFDEIIQFLLKVYNIKILSKADGPDARKWVLESKGKTFELVHDDMFGNSLIARTAEAESIVYEIGRDLENRLKEIDKSSGS